RCYVLRCLRPHRDLHPFPTRRSSDLFAIVDLDGVQSVVPWDDVELQPVSGMETDNPEFGLVWSAGATEPMTMTLDISALGDDSGVVDAASLGLDAGNLLRLTALVDEDLLDDELTDDDLRS